MRIQKPAKKKAGSRKAPSQTWSKPGLKKKGAKKPGQTRPGPTRGTSPPNAGEGERIQKILARAGLASRREAEEWIRAGRVTLNGEPVELGTRARGSDKLRLDGRMIHQAPVTRSATWLCHRSPGDDLTPPRDGEEDSGVEEVDMLAEEDRNAVSERLSRRVGRRYIPISPMPRSDGGLELLTSDGELAVRLQRAVRGLKTEFTVRVRGELNAQQIEAVLAGQLENGDPLQIEECEATGAGEAANRWYRVVGIGSNGRDLRRLIEQQQAVVSRVLRIGLGGLQLERTLTRGKVRQLTDSEIQQLLRPPA